MEVSLILQGVKYLSEVISQSLTQAVWRQPLLMQESSAPQLAKAGSWIRSLKSWEGWAAGAAISVRALSRVRFGGSLDLENHIRRGLK